DPRGSDTGFLIGRVVGTVFGALTMLSVIIAVVYGVARALGKARTPAGAVRLGSWTALVMLFLNLRQLLGGAHTGLANAQASRVTAAERADLRVTADSAWHADFGFMLPWPGGSFTENAALQRTLDQSLAGQPALVAWGYRDSTTQQLLVIQVAKMEPLDEKT